MDCTQVLESDDLNDSLAYKSKVKVAELKVNDNLYPIFSGSNRIGRDPEFCSVVFNNMTLSKEHAVIEVEDRFSHLIYDLGSKNKTRVGKTILKPHIRYQLVDKSQILLGDLPAEYYIVPEEQENKPFGVIQESDDEVIPDTPMQVKSRESKESSSSREESPTIFQMEEQCELGYVEPCVKIAQEPGVLEGNLAESSRPGENENKESSTAGASNTSDTAATGSSEVNVREADIKESTTEVNHTSDGDETDPEDIFFAMTQKRDESLLESSDREITSELKETVENGQPEDTDQVVDDSSVVSKATEDTVDNTRWQNSEKAIELPCSSTEDVSRAGNQTVVPEAAKIQEEGEDNKMYSEEEGFKENEACPEETHVSDSVETNGEGSTTSKTVIMELNEETGGEHLFKQPLAADKEQNKTEKTAQDILPVDEEMPGERIETVDVNSDLGSEEDSFFNAATQVLQPENQTSEVFKTPLGDTVQEQETNHSPGRNESCNVTGRKEESGGQECNSKSIPNAAVQVIQSEDGENSLGGKLETKEQVPCALAGKLNTCEEDDVEDSDATTDDESFFNAPTQVVDAAKEHAMPSPGAKPGKSTSRVSPDRLEICGKDEQEKEETLEADDEVKEADDFIFSAPTQVLQVKRKENNVSSEKDVEPLTEQHRSSGSSIEESSENDSIFDAPTQVIINSENLHENSSESSEDKKQPEQKEADLKQKAIFSDLESPQTDNSIYNPGKMRLHVVSEFSITFTTSTPAKKKSVKFVDLSDEHQSIEGRTSPVDSPIQEGTASESKYESISDNPTKVVEPGSVGSSSFKKPNGEPKLLNDVPVEENKKHMSEHGINSNQQGSSSEAKLPDSPQIHPLDDSDDSIFSAPTQVISKPDHRHDATSPRACTSGKFNSCSLGTEAVPKPALQIVENNEKETCSDQNSGGESIDASRKEDEEALNDSFFEAATQLYTSTALAEVIDSSGDDKANKSLSRSSSYSSIHEAPTQCMDDLVAELESEKAKEGVEKSGQGEEIQKASEVMEGTSAEEPLQEHESATAAAAAVSLANQSIDLILPSSQELRQVGQECYGYASGDEKPSTSNAVSSPIIQRRTRSIPVKKGILMARGLESIKSTVASDSRGTGFDSKGQPDSESTKQGKLPKDKKNLKKTAGKKKATTAKGSGKSKKITEYLESNNSRDKSVEKEDKNEENKASDESEMGRPSRQRKPTWKARESSQDGLLGATQKAKKGDTKEQSKVSPGPSKQTKRHASSPSNEVNMKENQNRKENSKLPIKTNTESSVNSESKLENNVKQKKSENLDSSVSSDKQRNIHVHSLSPPQSEDEKIPMKKGMKMKRSLKEVNESKTKELNTSSSPESCSSSDRRAQTSVDPSSSKKRGKGSVEPSSSVGPKAEKGTARSRKKPPYVSNDANQEVNPSHESLENEEVDQNKRSRPKQSTTVFDGPASLAKSVSKPALVKTQQESKANVDRQENKDASSSSIDDKCVNVGKRGRPRRANTASSTSSSDTEVKPGKRASSSRDKRTKTGVEVTPEKTQEYSLKKQKENSVSPCDKLDVRTRGRPKRSAASRASSVEVELKPAVRNKRTQDSDICDTPTKEKKISVSVSSSEQDKSVDAGKRGRAKRSANKAFSLDKELNDAVSTAQVERLQESDICDTPRKQRRNHVPSLESEDVEIMGTNRRGRSKRSATPSVSSERETCASSFKSSEVEIVETNKRGRSKRTAKLNVPVEKVTGASTLQSDIVEISETIKRSRSKKSPTPRAPLKRESSASLESGEVEIRGNNKRSRSIKSVVPNVLVVSKEELTPVAKGSDINAKPAPTSPLLARQRRTTLQSGNRTPNKANDASEQKPSRSRKKGVIVVASDEDQSMCGSPSYGSAGRKRKVLSQASSTESDGHSSQSEGTPKRSSRIKHHADYHIMFTGVGCTGADEAAIKKLGGHVVQEPEDCTILITDKIRRTFKFLCIMGHGKPIVTPDWIKQSHLSGHFLDPWNFIVKDKEAEKRFHFQLQKSLKEASARKLLDGYSVFATPSVKPPPIEMKGIVENCGGQFLTKEPGPGKWPEKSFIISAVDDKKQCSKFKKSSVPIVSAEILLTGILQQKLNISDYILKL